MAKNAGEIKTVSPAFFYPALRKSKAHIRRSLFRLLQWKAANTKERFITSSIQNLLNDPAALTHGKDRFEWIAVDAEHNIARNCVRGGIDKEPSEVGDYRLSRPFWGYSKEIWDVLYGAATSWQERWYQKTVWINLCKMRRARAEIRVKRGGRCSGKLAPSCSVPRLCSLIRHIFCS